MADSSLSDQVREALDARFSVKLPPAGSSPQQLYETLVLARASLDRVEEILQQFVLVRARTQRAYDIARAAVEDAWDEAAVKGLSPQGRAQADFIGPRERYANYNLATLDLRRTERQAKQEYDVVSEAYEVVRVAHRGLDGLRQDLHVLVRSQQVERALDR